MPRQRILRQHARQPGAAPGDPGGEVRELAGGRLERAVGVVDARAGGADAGMRAHPREQVSHVAGCTTQSGLSNRMNGEPARGAGAAIDAGGEAFVGGDRQEQDFGKRRGERVSRGRVAGVIDDDHPVMVAGRAERRQAVAQLVVALIVDDDHRQRRVVWRTTHRRIITNGPRRPRGYY